MGMIAWIILGLLAGLIARAILPGHDSVGVIVTLLIGVVGAIAGGLIAEAVGFAGSVVLLAILRAARSGRSYRYPLTH